jgi:hypothetical protein
MDNSLVMIRKYTRPFIFTTILLSILTHAKSDLNIAMTENIFVNTQVYDLILLNTYCVY